MLLGALLVLVAFIAIMTVKRLGGPHEATAAAFARSKLAALGPSVGWEVAADHTSIRDPETGAVLRVADPAYDHDAGATALELPGPRCATAFAVWPRDLPDSAVERWGPEVATGDELFDARFAVATRAPRGEVAGILGEAARAALLDLETPSLVTDDGRLLLLLGGVPDAPTLRRAAGALATVRRGLPSAR